MQSKFIESLIPDQRYLRRRIIEISHELSLSHLGSCFSAVDVIDAIYAVKKKGEKFILSNGHAGIALYVVLEKNGLLNNQHIKKLHIHPDRNAPLGIDVSTGSLGQGLPIALGTAFANRQKDVYCMISDGECAEGSIWEALRVAVDQKVDNLIIVVNANGWGAYDPIHLPTLLKRIKAFGLYSKTVNGHDNKILQKALIRRNKGKPTLIFAKTKVEQFPFLKGQSAHYYVMSENDYKTALTFLT